MSEYINAYFDLATELGRLRLLESIYDDFTIRNLEGTLVGGGWDCLEVGAGAGSIGRWLADRVGGEGSVTALDLKAGYLDELSRRPGAKVVEANIVDVPLGEEMFDLIHARAVLIHVSQRDQVLKKLVAALRPGGWLVVEEPGEPIQQVALDPQYPGSTEFAALWDRAVLFIRPTPDEFYGRELLPEFHRLGLRDLHGESMCPLFQGGTDAARWVRISSEPVFALMLAKGAVSQAEIDSLTPFFDEPGFFAPNQTFYGVRGRNL